ncbi:hypothetical protein BDV18DRAFT_162173 [Aspergillus unguis]
MVLKYTLLALASTAVAWATPSPESKSTLSTRQHFNDQFVMAVCPRSPAKCSDCGGDSKKKGWCDNEIALGYRSEYLQCKKWHDSGCGLVCECISEETGEPGTGLPPVIPFPIVPGFAAPPPAVPRPSKECPEDYTGTSCESCEPLEGWCTTGERMGCPCREECPADDSEDKPSCTADDCAGEKGVCTIGHYKGCSCAAECPDPEEKVLACDNKVCEGKDEKCTTEKYDGCTCSTKADITYSLGSKADLDRAEKVLAAVVDDWKKFQQEQDEEDEAQKPTVTCGSRDRTKAVDVDTSFFNKLADKFCSGGTDKQRSQDLTAKDVSSGGYEGYTFHFELDPGTDCKADCKDAFKSMVGKCQGMDSHSLQPEASAEKDCGASFSYKITVLEKEGDKTFTRENAWSERTCHARDQFGEHGPVDGNVVVWNAQPCGGYKEMNEDSDEIEIMHTDKETQYKYTISWIENCKGDEVYVRAPEPGHDYNQNGCWMTLFRNWRNCDNGGAGGYIDYGCVRYDFRPTFD